MLLDDLGPGPLPGDAAAALEAADLARRTADIELPSPVLDGWSSLCAAEYSRAVLGLLDQVGRAVDLLRGAAAIP